MTKLDNIKNYTFIHGRYYFENGLYLCNTGSGIEFNFSGSKISLTMYSVPFQQAKAWVKVIIDNDFIKPIDIMVGIENTINIDVTNETHNIKVLKASEAIESHLVITNLKVDGKFLDKPVYDKEIIIYGDSTVSAYGNLGNYLNNSLFLTETDGLNGYAFLTCHKLNATMNSVNGSGWGLCFSPWTTPKRRPLINIYDDIGPFCNKKYEFKNHNPYAIIISLGTNDSFYFTLREDEKPVSELVEEFMDSYHELLVKLKRDFPNTPIFMVYGVMRERHNYEVMHEIYLDNKDDFNLHECLIEGDGLGYGAHPSKESHNQISEALVKKIREITNE